ncbi:helix-turn-helix transcriptional regulator [Bacillus mexicanus]|uniref:helix-turn-helix domain-containing protein n=1 Tax=Bacillus mexicanus TaxID=2834415 RepID=UPI003D20896E
MKRGIVQDIIDGANTQINPVVLETAGILKDCYFVWKIDERRKERGISQKDLAKLTGLRTGTISNWENGKQGGVINLTILLTLMSALQVTKISDIVEIRVTPNIEGEFGGARNEWISSKEMPFKIKEMFHKNIKKKNAILNLKHTEQI